MNNVMVRCRGVAAHAKIAYSDTVHCSLLTIHCSLLTVHCSLFTVIKKAT